MPESDVSAALGALDLFEGTPPDLLERLAMVAHPFSISAGEYLFREGDPGDRMMLLDSGSIEAIIRLPGGKEIKVERLSTGSLIGEMGMLAQRPRRFSARAAEDSAGWSFAAAEIGQLGAAELPQVMRRLARLALERLRSQYALLSERCVEDPRSDGTARSADLDDAGPVVPVDPESEETAYLETVLFFSRFTPAEIEDMFGDLRRLEAPRGAEVVTASEAGPSVLIVLRGAVESSIRHGGLASRTRLAGPGRLVGHLNLLREEPAPASIFNRARERSILLEVPIERVAEIIDRGDDTSRRFGRALYADVVDALFEAQRPISRLVAAGG